MEEFSPEKVQIVPLTTLLWQLLVFAFGSTVQQSMPYSSLIFGSILNHPIVSSVTGFVLVIMSWPFVLIASMYIAVLRFLQDGLLACITFIGSCMMRMRGNRTTTPDNPVVVIFEVDTPMPTVPLDLPQSTFHGVLKRSTGFIYYAYSCHPIITAWIVIFLTPVVLTLTPIAYPLCGLGLFGCVQWYLAKVLVKAARPMIQVILVLLQHVWVSIKTALYVIFFPLIITVQIIHGIISFIKALWSCIIYFRQWLLGILELKNLKVLPNLSHDVECSDSEDGEVISYTQVVAPPTENNTFCSETRGEQLLMIHSLQYEGIREGITLVAEDFGHLSRILKRKPMICTEEEAVLVVCAGFSITVEDVDEVWLYRYEAEIKDTAERKAANNDNQISIATTQSSPAIESQAGSSFLHQGTLKNSTLTAEESEHVAKIMERKPLLFTEEEAELVVRAGISVGKVDPSWLARYYTVDVTKSCMSEEKIDPPLIESSTVKDITKPCAMDQRNDIEYLYSDETGDEEDTDMSASVSRNTLCMDRTVVKKIELSLDEVMCAHAKYAG